MCGVCGGYGGGAAPVRVPLVIVSSTVTTPTTPHSPPQPPPTTQLQDVAAQRATLHDAHAHILQQLDEAKLHSTWWLHSERRTAVAELQSKADSIQSQLRAQYNKAEALGAAQRQTMGLWSDRGVQSVRSFFWYGGVCVEGV